MRRGVRAVGGQASSYEPWVYTSKSEWQRPTRGYRWADLRAESAERVRGAGELGADAAHLVQIKVDNPSELPDAGKVQNLMEPYVKCAPPLM